MISRKRRRFIKENNLDFKNYKNKFGAIVIGASAGGIEALKGILQKIRAPFSLPIIIVQHIGVTGKQSLPKFFNEICDIDVKEAEDKESILPNTVYFAPPGYHLMIESDKSFSLSVEEHVNHARPAIDVLFSTAADVYQKKLVGILLTGANNDGAEGLKYIKEQGGTIIVQDPKTAKVPTMPASAIEIVKPNFILNMNDIENLMLELG